MLIEQHHSGTNWGKIYNLTESSIQSQDKYIDSYYVGDISGTTPYVLTSSFAPSWTTYGNYIFNFYKYANWENEPAAFEVMEILKNGSTVLKIQNSLGFSNLAKFLDIEDNFICTSLAEDTYLLLLMEQVYASQPSNISIILFYKNDVKLIYNKPMFINSVNTNNGKFEMELQSNTVEWLGVNQPANNADLHKIWSDGKYLYFK